MKKKIIISVFLLLILITAIIFIVGAIDTYNYEVVNDDIMVGFGAAMMLVIGGFVVFYELDFFYTAYYFLVKPKTITKSILNALSNFTLLLIFFTDSIAHFLYKYISKIFGEEIIVLFVFLFIYVILRIVCATISVRQSAKEN